MNVKVDVIAFIQNMAAGEILQHIPPEVLNEIKKDDPAPVLEAYRIAHEGESKSWVVGLGSKILKWYGQVIDKIASYIKPGTPVFIGHGRDNSHEGRTVVGKVIATIKNAKNEVISIIHRDPLYKFIKADVASFESPIQIDDSQGIDNHEVRPWEIGAITGIALGDSATVKPAFARAVKTAALQCLRKGEDNMPISLEDIHIFVRENKTNPMEIFTPEVIFDLPEVKDMIGKNKGNENQYYENKRLKSEITELKKTIADMDLKSKELLEKEKELATLKSEKLFDTQVAKREKLTEKQKAYIQAKRTALAVEPGKDLEAQINSFLDSQIKEFEDISKLFAPPAQENVKQEETRQNYSPMPGQTGRNPYFPD